VLIKNQNAYAVVYQRMSDYSSGWNKVPLTVDVHSQFWLVFIPGASYVKVLRKHLLFAALSLIRSLLKFHSLFSILDWA